MTEPPPDTGTAVGGLARVRALAARLTRPGQAGADAGPGTGAPVAEPLPPAPEPGPAPEPDAAPEPDPAPAGRTPVLPDREPGPFPAAVAPAPAAVVPGPEPDPEPDWAAPAPEPDSLAAPPAPPRRPRPPGRAAGLARPTVAERASAATAKLAEGWPFGRVIGIAVLIVALFSLLAIGVGGTALAELTSARSRVVDTLDPAANHAAQLEVELLNQETGVRGYALSGKPAFLTPYTGGLAGQQQQVTMLRQLLAGMPATIARLNQVLQRADTWRDTYAQPTIAQVRAAGKPVVSPSVDQGKADFDQIRAALAALQADIAAQHNQATGTLHSAASALQATLVVIAVALLAAVLVLAFGLWRSAILPLSRLASDARQVAEGDFEHQVEPGGPAEMRAVGADVNRMRERILAELSALQAAHATLEARTEDLQRSNSELEQFAYVASHDLQEPLRKVASFCQLLQRRYAGRLDAKADEYIEHAVDGAKRMQALINDLLAFSRVGRTAQRREPVSCAVLLAQAWANLAADVRRTHATIEVGELPVVLGEASLLTAVFQNLIGNALKFCADEPPRVSVSARRDGESWLFSFRDNGIGIEPEYAERIFVIFQRLHDKATYPGTGIGLAMARKIIEYHGGRIWLDTTITAGARFWFTLPALPEEEDADD
ncbi:MAG TPA: CHASE3 domain-containing protein [Streptosporangiaceae bacterium]|nr:CHASE3 domain-containing protein [Streptosporangiaceae bacterium]